MPHARPYRTPRSEIPPELTQREFVLYSTAGKTQGQCQYPQVRAGSNQISRLPDVAA